jgi:hypothetical protein
MMQISAEGHGEMRLCGKIGESPFFFSILQDKESLLVPKWTLPVPNPSSFETLRELWTLEEEP